MRRFLLLCAILAAQPPLGASGEIVLTLTPRVAMARINAPTYVRAAWRIAPHAENRWYSLIWISSTAISGSLLRDMDGDRAPVSYEMLLEVEGPAEYRVEACCYRWPSARRFCQSLPLTVL